MPLPFQPAPPPCAKCGTTTVIAPAPAFEGGQRVFAVRCPACGGASTYSLDYDTSRDGEPDPRTAPVGGLS
jgi:endogenous inhibitor of DNA gyrase (YacG/DUF329 family)